MKSQHVCRRCGGGRLWHVRPVREPYWWYQPTIVLRGWLNAKNLKGRFETFLCAACGYTEWYAYDLPSLSVPGEIRAAACLECGSHRRPFETSAHEFEGTRRVIFANYATDPDLGEFRWRICLECGNTVWLVDEINQVERATGALRARLTQRVDTERARYPCLGCGGSDALSIEPAKQHGSGPFQRMRVIPRIGEFVLRVCRSCSVTEWTARGLERLRVRRGVALLESPVDSGPYR